MNQLLNLASHGAVALSRRTLHLLRHKLDRDADSRGAAMLQEAGGASGEDLHAAFLAWLPAACRTDDPRALDLVHFAEALSRFLSEWGWGTVTASALGNAIWALDSTDWAEADDAGGARYPSCHFTCGLLADLIGRIVGSAVSVTEVECRSKQDAHCRFLIGAPETLRTLYERMAQGMTYAEALELDSPAPDQPA